MSENHPDRLASQHELARAYYYSGQVTRAVELQQHVVKIRQSTLPETHAQRIVSEQNLALYQEDLAEIDERASDGGE